LRSAPTGVSIGAGALLKRDRFFQAGNKKPGAAGFS
jgi:hypothetical protein